MGSSGYLTCGLCWQCGSCYPRKSACMICGGAIDLDEEACPACGSPIGEAQRRAARDAFMSRKYAEFAEAMGPAACSLNACGRTCGPRFPKGPSTR